jgi:hypothetical protein
VLERYRDGLCYPIRLLFVNVIGGAAGVLAGMALAAGVVAAEVFAGTGMVLAGTALAAIMQRYRSFEVVVFLTDDEQFVAFMPAWAAKHILNDPKRNQAFVDAINKGQTNKLYSCPGIVCKGISTTATNAEALREMVKQNSRFMVITDENNRLQGIAEREQVIGRMLLTLTN